MGKQRSAVSGINRIAINLCSCFCSDLSNNVVSVSATWQIVVVMLMLCICFVKV